MEAYPTTDGGATTVGAMTAADSNERGTPPPPPPWSEPPKFRAEAGGARRAVAAAPTPPAAATAAVAGVVVVAAVIVLVRIVVADKARLWSAFCGTLCSPKVVDVGAALTAAGRLGVPSRGQCMAQYPCVPRHGRPHPGVGQFPPPPPPLCAPPPGVAPTSLTVEAAAEVEAGVVVD